MSRKGPRSLTRQEQALWNKVAERTTPLRPERPAAAKVEFLQQKPVKPAPDPIPAFQIGEKYTATSLPLPVSRGLSEQLAQQPVQMDRKNFAKLKRGKLRPEARLDLHGMTLDRAHPALNRFILDSHAKGRRLVLVITGKGKDKEHAGPIPVRRGVLKHQVPHWLQSPPLSHSVLQISEAHLKHGGAGAYYVYLRRQR